MGWKHCLTFEFNTKVLLFGVSLFKLFLRHTFLLLLSHFYCCRCRIHMYTIYEGVTLNCEWCINENIFETNIPCNTDVFMEFSQWKSFLPFAENDDLCVCLSLRNWAYIFRSVCYSTDSRWIWILFTICLHFLTYSCVLRGKNLSLNNILKCLSAIFMS